MGQRAQSESSRVKNAGGSGNPVFDEGLDVLEGPGGHERV